MTLKTRDICHNFSDMIFCIEPCIEGAQAEYRGQLDRAHDLYQQAWIMAREDYEAAIAAHYLARHQEDLQDKLRWNQIALKKANAVDDPRVSEFLTSLTLCLGESYDLLGNEKVAQNYYALAAEQGAIHRGAG